MPIQKQRVITPDGPGFYLGRSENRQNRVQLEEGKVRTYRPSRVEEWSDPDSFAGIGLNQQFDIDSSDPPIVTVVELSSNWKAVVGFGWAVYSAIDPNNNLHTFIGWKQRSSRSEKHVKALEVVSAKREVGAPALTSASSGGYKLQLRQSTTNVPEVVPDEVITNADVQEQTRKPSLVNGSPVSTPDGDGCVYRSWGYELDSHEYIISLESSDAEQTKIYPRSQLTYVNPGESFAEVGMNRCKEGRGQLNVYQLTNGWSIVQSGTTYVYAAISPANRIFPFIGWKQYVNKHKPYVEALEVLAGTRFSGTPSLTGYVRGSYPITEIEVTNIPSDSPGAQVLNGSSLASA
jgi:hypothetical protein